MQCGLAEKVYVKERQISYKSNSMVDIFNRSRNPKKFYLVFILTDKCNLKCSYCYEHIRVGGVANKEQIKNTINLYLNNPLPDGCDECEITFFGGEPFICSDIIQDVCEWTWKQSWRNRYLFYANTNGTLLTPQLKDWLYINREKIWLGLSLDGKPETQNRNRCNSYDNIDLSFFLSTWPQQSVKMTIDPRHPLTFAEDIIHLHELGFRISGTDFAEGIPIDWEKLKADIIKEMDKLLEYYSSTDIVPAPIMDMWIDDCAAIREPIDKKWCGCGTTMAAYGVDGVRYPCTYFSPLTFSKKKLEQISRINFNTLLLSPDCDCKDCYIRPLCLTCYGANFEMNGSPSIRDKSKCLFMKLRALYSAKLLTCRLLRRVDYYKKNYPTQTLMLTEAAMHIHKEYSCLLES